MAGGAETVKAISAALLLATLGTQGLQSESALAAIPPAVERIQAAAALAKAPFPLVNPEIRVFKADHRLELWASGKRIKSYKVALGNAGLARKRVSGDHLTPEGQYYVCIRNAQSKYHLFLGVSYPNEISAERGYRAGLVSKHQRDAIIAANHRKVCPPWDTGLGGTVGIHGHGSRSDWTWGCVALENDEMDEIWAASPVGTPIMIKP